jgi:hypothetical protein
VFAWALQTQTLETQFGALSWRNVVPEAAFPRRGELNVVVTVSAEKIIVNCQRCISGVSVGALRRNSEGQVVLAVFLYALHA